MISPPPLWLHSFVARSAANGPGVRSVVWTQGCTIGCSGCFNPRTHSRGGTATAPAHLVELVVAAGVEGLTISGGEPLEQAEATLAVAAGVRGHGLSVILLTGFAWPEIERRWPHVACALADCVDVVIAGRYVESRRVASALRGSDNKKAHFFTDRYTDADMQRTPDAEIIIGPDGAVVMTGVAPIALSLPTEDVVSVR